MRVALTIEGNAEGAVEAAEKTSRAVTDLGRISDVVSHGIEDGFKKSLAAIQEMADKAKPKLPANDNSKESALALAQQIEQVASKALGADSALAKMASGAVSVAKGVADIVRAAGPLAIIGTALAIAVTVATAFYMLTNRDGAEAERRLAEHGRLIGVMRDAYGDAANKAGAFYRQSKAVTELQAQQNLVAQRALLADSTKAAIRSIATSDINTGQLQIRRPAELRNEDQLIGKPDPAIDAFEQKLSAIAQQLAAGTIGAEKFRDEVAALGLAAGKSTPALELWANQVLSRTAALGEQAVKTREAEAYLRVLAGTASDADKKLLGMAKDSTNEFDRMTKSLQRQSAAQEAAAVGKSAGEVARLRAEFMLKEAAEQADIKLLGAKADAAKKLADRYGEAAQRVSELKLRSDAAFERSQLGRDPTEAASADRLRSVYGDDFQSKLEGSEGAALRLNEQLRGVKESSVEFGSSIAKGALAGANGMEVLNSAVGRLRDRLIDTIVNTGFSKFFGAVLGGGAPAPLIYGPGYDAGGYTGSAARGAVAGLVHGQEFVVNAAATARHRALLEAINDNRMPGYADGGFVQPIASPASFAWPRPQSGGAGAAGGHSVAVQLTMHNDFRGATMEAVAELSMKIAQVEQSVPDAAVAAVEHALTITPTRVS